MKYFVVTFVTMLLLAGCVGPAKKNETGTLTAPIDVTPDLSQVHCGSAQESSNGTGTVLRTQQAWEDFWTRECSARNGATVPGIDFAVQMVIAFSWRVLAPGYAFHLEGVKVQNETLVIDVQRTAPGAGCAVFEATVTSILVVVDRSPGTPRFVPHDNQPNCGNWKATGEHVQCTGYNRAGFSGLVRDRISWSQLWDEFCDPLMFTFDPPQRIHAPLPELSFPRQQLVVYFWDTNSNSGKHVTITNVTVVEGHATAEVLRTSPGGDCLVFDGVPYPVEMMVVEGAIDATFNVTDLVADCN